MHITAPYRRAGIAGCAALALTLALGVPLSAHIEHVTTLDPPKPVDLGAATSGDHAFRQPAPATAAPASIAYDDAPVGTYRNGRRVLRPYEPARKRERDRYAYYEQGMEAYHGDAAYQGDDWYKGSSYGGSAYAEPEPEPEPAPVSAPAPSPARLEPARPREPLRQAASEPYFATAQPVPSAQPGPAAPPAAD